jgi:hypothetical protein
MPMRTAAICLSCEFRVIRQGLYFHCAMRFLAMSRIADKAARAPQPKINRHHVSG